LAVRYSEQDERIDLSAVGPGIGRFSDTRTSLGAFGELRWRITDKLRLTAGARLQQDNQDRDGALGGPVNFDKTFSAFLPKLELSYHAMKDLTVGALVQQSYNPGGTTVSFVTGQPDFFDAEYLTSYELFGRWKSRDGRLALNANLFYNRFRDSQRVANRVVNNQIETTIDNAERAYSVGAELSLRAQASARLQILAGLGLLHTEIEEFSTSRATAEGREFAKAPKVTASLGFDWTIIEGLHLNPIARYVGSYFSDDFNTPATKVDDRVICDMQLSYRYRSHEVFAYANNLFDQFYVVQDFGGLADVGNPREFGMGVKLAF
jgi:outer membrane receptor protein involved in Fe transport